MTMIILSSVVAAITLFAAIVVRSRLEDADNDY